MTKGTLISFNPKEEDKHKRHTQQFPDGALVTDGRPVIESMSDCQLGIFPNPKGVANFLTGIVTIYTREKNFATAWLVATTNGAIVNGATICQPFPKSLLTDVVAFVAKYAGMTKSCATQYMQRHFDAEMKQLKDPVFGFFQFDHSPCAEGPNKQLVLQSMQEFVRSFQGLKPNEPTRPT